MVPQSENFSPANQYFLIQLGKFGDSVLHIHLSNIADTPEKRNYLHAMYIAANGPRGQPGGLAYPYIHSKEVLQLYSPAFQSSVVAHTFVAVTIRRALALQNYLWHFLRDPERSRLLHCDIGLWSTVVTTRYMRYLGATFIDLTE